MLSIFERKRDTRARGRLVDLSDGYFQVDTVGTQTIYEVDLYRLCATFASHWILIRPEPKRFFDLDIDVKEQALASTTGRANSTRSGRASRYSFPAPSHMVFEAIEAGMDHGIGVDIKTHGYWQSQS